ncbi:uncharacterized protein Gasu_50290 [Galdieria sulphuraria]|uniref:MAGE domain-containing protein n=1 Tax=Galdieria sulphuraria TaxID=130081 RepID=M2VW30_GALSU|nr:uncharacterized protein Gasu_50290 [Galdieria sulphuraria]EME27436.1 hypothetical protein Gasu_50290 [Galdieria sulphuraria]|eukprot:XP_005703956.1 hypothetical protein Gasu_50290 [Galdieria sulphuraria]
MSSQRGVASNSQVNELSSGEQKYASSSREGVVSAVCRHLLVATGKRAVVRRDDISQYVGKCFKTNDVLKEASARLEEVFGLKIVELSTESKNGKGSVNALSSQAGPSRSKSSTVNRVYILINTLTTDEEDDWKDDDECSFWGVLTVVIALLFVSPNTRLSEEKIEKLLKSLYSLGLHQERAFQGSSGKFTLLQDLVKMWYLRKEQVEDEIFYTLGPRIFKELSSDGIIVALEKLLQVKLEADYRELLLKQWESMSSSV